jgi:hypothetical protein
MGSVFQEKKPTQDPNPDRRSLRTVTGGIVSRPLPIPERVGLNEYKNYKTNLLEYSQKIKSQKLTMINLLFIIYKMKQMRMEHPIQDHIGLQQELKTTSRGVLIRLDLHPLLK